MAQNGTLTTKQQKFIDAMMTQPTVTAAAIAAGIGRRTADRYLADPVVKAALQEAQSAALADISRRLVSSMGSAITTLEEIHAGAVPFTSAPARVSAARAILDSGLKYCELADLERRLMEIEKRLEEVSHGTQTAS